ncbi:MAG: DUF6261 family protein [Prevotellaceae bacterium]|jgi:hypothetical protein|nr:DUF6261 family protein [Prevotellaceae bacterium]
MKNSVLKVANTTRYTIANHIEFHTLGLGICQKFSAEIAVPPLIDGYTTALDKEISIYKWTRRSNFTKKKMEIDNKRDTVYTGITGTVRINMKHFDPMIRDAAMHINNMLSSYENVTQMNYDAETATINSIISRIRSDAYAPAMQLIGLQPWVNELELLNTQFKEYVEDTSQEQMSKPDISQKESRKLTDKALSLITDRVEAIVIFNGEATISGFISEYNNLAKHYNTLVNERYGRTHSRSEIINAEVAPIPTQVYTGKPIIVIPELIMRDVDSNDEEISTELVFSKDFTVTYNDNIMPGLATMLISGLGKYKGERIVTFNIERI